MQVRQNEEFVPLWQCDTAYMPSGNSPVTWSAERLGVEEVLFGRMVAKSRMFASRLLLAVRLPWPMQTTSQLVARGKTRRARKRR